MGKESSFKEIKFVFDTARNATPKMIMWQSIISLLQAIESFVFNVILIKSVIMLLESKANILYVITLALFAIALKSCVVILNSIYTNKVKPICSIEISRYLDKKLYQKALTLDLEQYESKEFHDKYYQAISDAQNTVEKVLINSIELINNSLASIAIICYVISINAFLTIMIILPLITSSALKYSNNIRYKCNKDNLKLKREMDYVNRVSYLKDFALEVRLTNIFSSLKKRYDVASHQIIKNYLTYGKVLTIFRFVSDYMMTTFTIMFSYVYVGWLYIFKHNINFSDFAVLVSAISNMNFKVSCVLNNIYSIQDSTIYLKNIHEFLNEIPKISKNLNGFSIKQSEKFIINFKNVSFRYSENSEYAIQGINVSIKKGEKIAIVGKNGSGKSTFIKLLMRLYDVTDGCISINDMDIKCADLKSYRDLFSSVFQDFKLFAVSIKENISLGYDKSDEQLYHSLENVGLEKYIESLDDGLDSIVTKELDGNGVVLSGGQEQKLALARGFSTNANVIIFDEPSASLDPEAEAMLFENIYRFLGTKTVIFVSHRLTSAIRADKIVMMDKGKVIEVGRHEELMNAKGEYYRLFNIQAEAYRGERQ